MNELELARALYLLLAEEDQRIVVKKAAEKGFVVDGVSKNVSKAPRWQSEQNAAENIHINLFWVLWQNGERLMRKMLYIILQENG